MLPGASRNVETVSEDGAVGPAPLFLFFLGFDLTRPAGDISSPVYCEYWCYSENIWMQTACFLRLERKNSFPINKLTYTSVSLDLHWQRVPPQACAFPS